MDFIKVAKVSDFDKKRIKSIRIIGKPIAIIKESNGNFYAVEASCKHQNADLTKGKIIGNLATCQRHGWKYDLKTGQCLNHDSAPLRHYDLKIDGEDIYISIHPVESDL